MAGDSTRVQHSNRKDAERAVANLAEVLGDIRVGGKQGLADVGIVGVNRIKRVLSTPGTGRMYRRPGASGPRAVLHRASSPGQPPAPDTGKYRSSWNWRLGTDARGDYVEIGTNDKRGPWFEYGTRRMKARPHLRPMVNTLRDEITDLVRKGIIEKQKGTVRRLPKEIR